MKKIIKKIASFYDEMALLLNYFEEDYFLNLPNIILNWPYDLYDLPKKVSCVYFLYHEKHGVLYIGKAKDLYERWKRTLHDNGIVDKEHHKMADAIELGNVHLCWLELDNNLTNIVEHVFIRNLHPIWNTKDVNIEYQNLKKSISMCYLEINDYRNKRVRFRKNMYEKCKNDPELNSIGTIKHVHLLDHKSKFHLEIEWDNQKEDTIKYFSKYEFLGQFIFI